MNACLYVLVLALVLGGCSHGSRAVTCPGSAGDFLGYLSDRDRPPSMIAFSPTNHDPREGTSYLIPSRESLRADLTALGCFDGLILYGFDPNYTPVLVDEARRAGFRAVLLGIWDIHSATERDGVTRIVNENGNALSLAVCLGNEGITFGRYTMEDLVAAAETLRTGFRIPGAAPITTSEPFSAYGEAVLRSFGAFLSPNIHPVFDRPDLSAAEAARWTVERARSLAEVSDRPVLIKETGFPGGGDPRFSPQTQAEFWGAYVMNDTCIRMGGSARVFTAAAFESFRLPWKAEQSGMPIERFWGFLTEEREPLPAYTVWCTARGRRGDGS